jgi:IclR family transcriptional regulator, acetate operon repressor
MENTAGTTIQSVARASRILLAVARSEQGLTATEVAKKHSLTLSTAHHLLSTLTREGLLSKVEGKRYEIGPAGMDIANSATLRPRSLRSHRDALRRLADLTQETTFLTGWHHKRIRILATVEGAQAVRVAGLEVGFDRSAHARAGGKLLLAFTTDEVREGVLGHSELVRHTVNTITDRALLDAEFEHIRADDIALDREEFQEGVVSLSAPVRRDGQVVAALTVSMPSGRFRKSEGLAREALRMAVVQAES